MKEYGPTNAKRRCQPRTRTQVRNWLLFHNFWYILNLYRYGQHMQIVNKVTISGTLLRALGRMGGGRIFLKSLRDTSFNKDLSNEPNFGLDHLAGQYGRRLCDTQGAAQILYCFCKCVLLTINTTKPSSH
jgi:hypothetical protein